ncbi:sensor domain-containing diguanylate cyclase [Neobacillus notoginsengisoli]|uniref:sensor domain-containing diguanylate cyclase n=1 Tax=Neobacillus notoginsengisoli TaxID=1578198 RepID=UPI001314EAD2|nr:sensor domain-containing diguanylate cyclase [Neobacillus notoginsengisoli]
MKNEKTILLERVEELEKKMKDLEKSLRISEQIKLNILNVLPINIFLEDREGRTVFVNDQVLKAHGMDREELFGKTVYDFFPHHIAELNRKVDLEVWKQRKLFTNEILGGFQGEERDLLTGKTIVQAETEDYLLGFALDITDRVKAERMLRESEELFRNVVDQAADSIFLIDLNGRLLKVNAAAAGMLGYSKEELNKRGVSDIFAMLPQKLIELKKCVEGNESCHFEDSMSAYDGNLIPVDLNLRLINTGGKKIFLALGRDIRERKEAERAIQHMAFHDALTGLPNRWYIQSYSKAFCGSEGSDELGILLLDLDHFKVINDNMGHQAGDSLLKDVASRLKSVCNDGNIVARFGGDEFIVLIPNIKSKDEALETSKRIFDTLEKPFLIHSQKVVVTASIGISVSPADGTELNRLIRNADLAMYRSKQNGRNCCMLYDPSLEANAVGRLELEIAMHRASGRE